MVTIVILSKFDHETEDIQISLIIEITVNTVNQSTHYISQDIIKSNRDIIRVPKIGNISTKHSNSVIVNQTKSNYNKSRS
jgi:hypothetical protein